LKRNEETFLYLKEENIFDKIYHMISEILFKKTELKRSHSPINLSNWSLAIKIGYSDQILVLSSFGKARIKNQALVSRNSFITFVLKPNEKKFVLKDKQ